MLVKTMLESKPKELVTTKPSTKIDEAMDLLISKNIGCLPVLDDGGKLIGIVSDKDIFKKIHETHGDYHSLSVKDVMSDAIIVGLPDDDISYIAGLMGKNWIRHVPIVENDQLIGLVSQRDIIKTQAKKAEIENRYLKLYLNEMNGPSRSGDL
jgi:CBS domain-containing protein